MSTPASKRQRKAKNAPSSVVGANEALTTLVSQFADPLVFLRELVQNSLDAASTQISIQTSFDPQQTKDSDDAASGLMTITVLDNGEGMTEHIIDNYLLTLFSSTKENDLTKIGKFGVGFVSIFALEPELVVCETGQSGESWRVLFHADKSFEKLRLDEPIEGTSLALHKTVSRGDYEDLRRRAATTLRYWCKYAEADIDVDGVAVGEELGLPSAALSVRHGEPGTDLVLGFPAITQDKLDAYRSREIDDPAQMLTALVGFYNRGLTLVEAKELPDEQSTDLAGISMRVKSRYLEHTLTRDNVRADENYYKAIELVRSRVHSHLRPRLVQHLSDLAAHHCPQTDAEHPGGPGFAAALLYARLPSMHLSLHAENAEILPTTDGGPISLRALRKQGKVGHGYPVAARDTPLTTALQARGLRCVQDAGGVKQYLMAVGLATADPHQSFYTAIPVEVPDAVLALLPQLIHLLDRAKTKISGITFGAFDYPHSLVADQLFIRQEEPFALTEVGDDDRATLFGGARAIVLGWHHRVVQKCASLAVKKPALAAHILAQAICVAEQVDRERRENLGPIALGWHVDRMENAS